MNPERRSEGREKRSPYFKIDEDKVTVDPTDPNIFHKPRFYRIESMPIDGRTYGAVGPNIATGSIEHLAFEIRAGLPSEGLFIDTEHREETHPGQLYKFRILVSSEKVLQDFLEKHQLERK